MSSVAALHQIKTGKQEQSTVPQKSSTSSSSSGKTRYALLDFLDNLAFHVNIWLLRPEFPLSRSNLVLAQLRHLHTNIAIVENFHNCALLEVAVQYRSANAHIGI